MEIFFSMATHSVIRSAAWSWPGFLVTNTAAPLTREFLKHTSLTYRTECKECLSDPYLVLHFKTYNFNLHVRPLLTEILIHITKPHVYTE